MALSLLYAVAPLDLLCLKKLSVSLPFAHDEPQTMSIFCRNTMSN